MGKRRNTTRKALRIESLEARQLMAADIGLHHGILNVRGTHQDDVIKMEQVQVGQSSQKKSLIKVSVANKRGRVLKAAQFDGRAVKSIKAYGFNGHDRIVNRTDIPSYLNGGNGNDVLQGGAAADQVFGSYGNDTLSGGGGNDRIYGNNGKDNLRGGPGHDKLYGGSGSDRIYGNSGNDYVSGGSGNDRIYGCGGHDVLHGGSGNDLVRGDDGNDHLYAGTGRDKLYGDRGEDFLHRSSSRDRASGGQGRDRIKHDRKAASTAAARKIHEASIADSTVESLTKKSRSESSQGAGKDRVARRDLPRTYRQHGVTFDQLKKLQSVKPIHAKNNAEDNNSSDRQRELKVEGLRQLLGLNDAQATEVARRAKLRSLFLRVQTSEDAAIERDASAASLDVDVDDAEKAGLGAARDLWEMEGLRQDLGIEDTMEQLIDEANKERDKDSDSNPRSGRPIDHVFARYVRKQNDLAQEGDGTVQDALQEAAESQTWGKDNIEKLSEGNSEGTQGTDDDPLESLESNGAPQKPAAALGESGLPETDHPTAQDGDPYANGLGSDWQYTPGSDDSGSGDTGSNDGSGSGQNSDSSSNDSPNGNDDGGSGGDDGAPSDPSGDDSNLPTENQNDSKPKSESQAETEGANNENVADDNSSSNTGGSENSNGDSATDDRVIVVTGSKTEADQVYSYNYLVKTSSGVTTEYGTTECVKGYCSDNGGTWYTDWFGTAPQNGETRSGQSNEDNAANPKITGNCDGMNPWRKKGRKAPKRIVRNPGNIDPINPNFTDAVLAAVESAEERAREGLGNYKRKAARVAHVKPTDNPTSEDSGHTCPTSGDADRSE